MEKEKVILLGSAYPLRGGLSAFNERLIREFQSQGFECEIYTFKLQYPSFLFPGKTQYSDDPAPVDLNINVKVNSINPFNWIKVGFELRKKKPKLLIVKFWLPFMSPCFGTICRIAKRNNYTKVVSIVDNILPHEKRPGDRILAKYWTGSADGFIAMSKNVLNDLAQFTSKPKYLSPHPIYDNYGSSISKTEARSKLGIKDEAKYVLFFGFIRRYKGLDILLEALADERLKQLNVKAIIAGEFYSDSQYYLDIVDKLNLKDRLILATDFIPNSGVATYFCASDVVVQPYISATQSGVTQIAYNFDKPIITTNVGGLEEFVENEKVGFVVEPDKNQIADSIYSFYTNKLEERFILGVIEEKKRFSWIEMVNSLLNLLKN